MSANQNATITMRLRGARQVTLEAEGTAAAVNKVAAAATRASLATNEAASNSFLYNQALFTLRRGVYALTLGMAAATVGVIGFGLKFNSSMQQNEVAFTHFLGNADLARQYISKLFDLAAHTPFEFQGLVDSTKQLLAFGYSGDQAYRTMVDIGDAVSGLGSGSAGIDRLTLAFGQMLTNGRILGGELRQLGEAGINARKYLKQAFNLTADQMAHIGQLQIPAKQGIEAILRGMEAEFGGLAEAQASTFQGILSTIHDYSEKLFGTITKPLFEKLAGYYLPWLSSEVQLLDAAFEQGGMDQLVRTLDRTTNSSGNLVRAWNLLAAYGSALWDIIKNSLWPATSDLLKVMGILAFVIGTALLPVFQFLADHASTTRAVFAVLITYMTIQQLLAWRSAFANTALGLALGKVWQATLLTIQFTKALIIWMRREYALWGLMRIRLVAVAFATAAWMTATRLATGALAAMNLMLEATPVGWILTAIALIAVALYILIFHFDAVKSAAQRMIDWIRNHMLLVAILFGPIGIFLVTVIKVIDVVMAHLDSLINKAKRAWGWVKGIWNSIPGTGIAGSAVGFVTGHASGGMMGTAGLTLVGEQGPELLSLPAGATIKPHDQVGIDPSHAGMLSLALTSIVEIDRREIARAYQTYVLDQAARA